MCIESYNIVILFFFPLSFLSFVLKDKIQKTDKPYHTSMQLFGHKDNIEKNHSIILVGKQKTKYTEVKLWV